MIKEFDINKLRVGPLGGHALLRGGKLLHGMKTVNFYYGNDHHRVPNIRVYRGMRVTKAKYGRFLEIDLNEESEEFIKFLEDTSRRLAGGCLN